MARLRYPILCIVVQYLARDSVVFRDGSIWLEFVIDWPESS